MSTTITLSLAQARQLHLAAQGMQAPLPARGSRADLLVAIARMRLLQIDTISVVARSPYLVLYARIGAYDPLWLEQALARTELIETWAHEACFARWPVMRNIARTRKAAGTGPIPWRSVLPRPISRP